MNEKSCCFRGWISHEVYFHSKGRPVGCWMKERFVLLAFLGQFFTDQSGNGMKNPVLREYTEESLAWSHTKKNLTTDACFGDS